MDGDYQKGALITGGLTFVVAYIYCIVTCGFLLGVGLGWLPSNIVAVFAGFLWPFVVLAIGIVIAFVFFSS